MGYRDVSGFRVQRPEKSRARDLRGLLGGSGN